MQNSHRATQNALKNALAPEEVWLERNFSSIGRIADVVWPAQKVVFEVQYSPISPREIRARNRAYHKIGYAVVWILHDRHFNRPTLTPAEKYLSAHTHYFTDINEAGEGTVYDQYALTRFGRRVAHSRRYPIDVKQLYFLKHMPRHFIQERRKWEISFAGDLFHHPFSPQRNPFSRFYRALFRLLLQKFCS